MSLNNLLKSSLIAMMFIGSIANAFGPDRGGSEDLGRIDEIGRGDWGRGGGDGHGGGWGRGGGRGGGGWPGGPRDPYPPAPGPRHPMPPPGYGPYPPAPRPPMPPPPMPPRDPRDEWGRTEAVTIPIERYVQNEDLFLNGMMNLGYYQGYEVVSVSVDVRNSYGSAIHFFVNGYNQGTSFNVGYQQFYPRFGRNIIGQDVRDLRLRVEGQSYIGYVRVELIRRFR